MHVGFLERKAVDADAALILKRRQKSECMPKFFNPQILNRDKGKQLQDGDGAKWDKTRQKLETVVRPPTAEETGKLRTRSSVDL